MFDLAILCASMDADGSGALSLEACILCQFTGFGGSLQGQEDLLDQWVS